MSELTHHTIVLHNRPGIHNTALTNLRAGIDHCLGEHYRASTNQRILTNNCSRMNNRYQPATRSRQLTLLNLANPVITNGNHNAIKALNIFQQRSGVANNRPWPVLCQPRPGIIKKHHLIPARQPGSIGYHLAVATGTENRKAHQSLLPVNLDIVTSPSPLIPSRTSTFFTVRTRIFTSSQSD